MGYLALTARDGEMATNFTNGSRFGLRVESDDMDERRIRVSYKEALDRRI